MPLGYAQLVLELVSSPLGRIDCRLSLFLELKGIIFEYTFYEEVIPLSPVRT